MSVRICRLRNECSRTEYTSKLGEGQLKACKRATGLSSLFTEVSLKLAQKITGVTVHKVSCLSSLVRSALALGKAGDALKMKSNTLNSVTD